MHCFQFLNQFAEAASAGHWFVYSLKGEPWNLQFCSHVPHMQWYLLYSCTSSIYVTKIQPASRVQTQYFFFAIETDAGLPVPFWAKVVFYDSSCPCLLHGVAYARLLYDFKLVMLHGLTSLTRVCPAGILCWLWLVLQMNSLVIMWLALLMQIYFKVYESTSVHVC